MLRSGLKSAIVVSTISLGLLWGQSASSVHPVSANDLLRQVLQNEVAVQSADRSHWTYQVVKPSSGKDCRREKVIQTKDGEIGHLIQINGRPLTADQEAKEEDRIQSLLNNAELQRKKQKEASDDARRAAHFVKIMPDAVIATFGQRQGDLQELNFTPNPAFRPLTREDEVLHAMAGRVWVSLKEKRLAEIDGHLNETVRFGGGLLGYLEQGGQFQVKQSEVGPGHWEVTLLRVDMKGKALCFKTINVHQDEAHTNFERVADDLTLAQGAGELREQLHTTAQLRK